MAVVVARVEVPLIVRVPIAVRLPPIYVLPATVRSSAGVVLPIPNLPACVNVKSDTPVEEAIAKGFFPASDWRKIEAMLAVVVPARRPPKNEVPPW